MVTVGVLALQGGFHEHLDLLRIAAKTVLSDAAFNAIPVRTVAHLDTCDALIIPGGESTTMTLLANNGGLMEPLRKFVQSDKPVWGESSSDRLSAKAKTSRRNLCWDDYACG